MSVAIVTGAGRGIGRAVAVHLARRGWGVVGVSRTAAELDETGRLCGEAAGESVSDVFEPVVASVTEPTTAARAVESAQRRGRLRAVVYCAGVAPAKSVEETSVELFREVLETNLTGAFVFAQAAWGAMKAGGGGAVVLVSSMAARDPFPGFVAYGPAKAAVNLLATVLDREGKPAGIRAYAVAPGAVETAMFRQLATPEQWPADRTLSPDDVAAVIGACVEGDLRYSGGETIYLSKA